MFNKGLAFAAVASTLVTGAIATLTTTQINAQMSGRFGYRVVDVKQFVNQNKLNNLNPNQTAVRLFSNQEEADGRNSENVEVKYSRSNTAVVLMSKEGLADDSVRAIRQRVEMRQNQNGKWEVVWVGEQNKCQPSRGSQVWTSKLCS